MPPIVRLGSRRHRGTPSVHASSNASVLMVRVTNPTDALFGKELPLDFVSRNKTAEPVVFLKRGDGSSAKVPIEFTSLYLDPIPTITSKMIRQSVLEFISLLSEFQVWNCDQPASHDPGLLKSGTLLHTSNDKT